MSDQVRVLVVDDSAFMRSMLTRLIEKDPRFKVIDAAVNGKEGVEKANALKPDVMTLDVEMPVMTGLEALEEVMKTSRTPVIMLSTLTEEGASTTLDALEKGAVDFLPKSLQDKDKNVFKSSEVLHDKLLAASKANLSGFAAGAQPAAPAAPIAKPIAMPKVEKATTPISPRVIVLGSSTGGPKALQELIKELPATLSAPMVIAQHMPANFTKALATRLDESCAIHVKELEDGEMLRSGTIYIAPGGGHSRVTMSAASVRPDQGESLFKPSVDVLGDSALKAFGGKVLAVMLTGMGEDGAKSFEALSKAGAYVIAQDEATSTVYGMPRAVAERGVVNEVLPLSQIAKRITALVR